VVRKKKGGEISTKTKEGKGKFGQNDRKNNVGKILSKNHRNKLKILATRGKVFRSGQRDAGTM